MRIWLFLLVALGLGLFSLIFGKQILRRLFVFFPALKEPKTFANDAASVGKTLAFVSVTLLVAATAGLFAHSQYFGSFPGSVIGQYDVFDRPAGYRPFSSDLVPVQSPVKVILNVTQLGSYQKPGSRTDLIVTVSLNGETIYEVPVAIRNSLDPTKRTAPVLVYELPKIEVTQSGTYQFSVTQRGAEGLSVRRIGLELKANPSPEGKFLRVAVIFLFITGMVTALAGFKARAIALKEQKTVWPGAFRARRNWGRDAADR